MIYLGHMIGGGEMRIDLEKIVVITQWPIPTNVTEIRSFMGASWHLRKLFVKFSTVAAPLHAITSKGKRLR